MGVFDRLFGRTERRRAPASSSREDGYAGYGAAAGQTVSSTSPSQNPDAVAVERYRYLLRTVPPEAIEQAHVEAFAKLTPQQRRQVLTDVADGLPTSEQATSDDPRSLARMATRAELRQPGYLESRLGYTAGMGGRGLGMGMGGIIGGSLLGSVAGAFIGTAVAEEIFGGWDEGTGETGPDDGGGAADARDAGYDQPSGFGDVGGDMGDYGGGDLGDI
jgi:hypothetical protein